MKSATHPVHPCTVTFDPTAYRYRDDRGVEYLFATRLVELFFEPFDKLATAERIADRTGRTALEVIAEWDAKGKAASRFGNHVHAYAAAVVQGEARPQPATEAEALAFRVVDRALEQIAQRYDILAAEQLIFHPLAEIAALVDLVLRDRESGALCVVDWKTNEEISRENYGKFGCPPLMHVPDSKFARYGLQVSVEGWILRAGEWIAPDEPIECALIHVAPHATLPQWLDVPFAEAEATAMVQAWWSKGDAEASADVAGKEAGAGE